MEYVEPQWLAGQSFAFHSWIRFRYYLPGLKGGAWVLLEPSDPRLTFPTFYQPVLSGANASKIKKFEGLPLSSYTLKRWVNIFQVLEADIQ